MPLPLGRSRPLSFFRLSTYRPPFIWNNYSCHEKLLWTGLRFYFDVREHQVYLVHRTASPLLRCLSVLERGYPQNEFTFAWIIAVLFGGEVLVWVTLPLVWHGVGFGTWALIMILFVGLFWMIFGPHSTPRCPQIGGFFVFVIWWVWCIMANWLRSDVLGHQPSVSNIGEASSYYLDAKVFLIASASKC